jgi:pimeloyl-ACP methyl ester carboxylesterase
MLAGNSAGGRIAWHVAAAHPDRVQALILLDAGGYPRTTPLPTALAIAKSPIGPLLMSFVNRSQAEAGAKAIYADPRRLTPETVDRSLAMILRPGNRSSIGATLRQDGGGADADLVKSIRTPTLIIWGSEDKTVPLSDADRFHRDIAGSRLVVLSGVGHLPQEESPTESLSAARDILSGH